MGRDTPRKSAPVKQGEGVSPVDAEGEEGERSSGEYCFVYHEVARITTVRKSMPVHKPDLTNELEAHDAKSKWTP